ncbi:hypothetical protein Tco_0796136 [Tanacetum coccineum]
MAKLAFCDYHNMVAILEKTEHNADFHQIVDFLEASHIRYALMVSPTVYVSHIRQFWSTARVETVDGETNIIAKVNGKQRTVSESSIRRHLKLNDEEVSKSKEYWTVQLFESMLVPQGEGLANSTEPHHTPSAQYESTHQEDQTTSPKPIQPDIIVPSPSHSDIPTPRRLTRGTIQISQSKIPLPGADETASPTRDDIHKEAFPTATSLDAGQDRENIAKTSAMPHESSPRVTSLDGGKGSMQQKLQELMDMCTNLQQQHLLMEQRIQSQDLEITQLKNRVKTLEDNEKTREGFSLKDALNTRGMDQGEDLIAVNAEINNEKSTKKGSDSTYEMANVLSTLGVANVLSSGIIAFAPAGVTTASGSFPTTAIFTTTSVTTPYTRKTRASRGIIIESSPPIYISIPSISKEDKGKGIMTEPEQPSKEKSKVPLPGADETASPTRDDKHREAFPTATSLDAGQDRENIAKTFVMTHESSSRVTSLDGGGGSMQQKLQELMDMCTNLEQQHLLMEQRIQSQDLEITQLKNRVKTLEDNEKTREGFALEDAPNTGGMDQGEDLIVINDEINNEKSTEKGSDMIDEMANVLSTLGAANGLSSGITTSTPTGVATASGSFPTTAIFTTTSEDKGKGIMTKLEQPVKKRIHAERELEMMIAELDRSNELVVKCLCEYEQVEAELSHDKKVELINELLENQRNLAQIKKYQAHQIKDFKGMTFEQIEEKFISVWEKIQDFVPMNSKLESERVKRPGSQLVQESSKKLKTTKASDMLKKFDREDLDRLWSLVKKTFSTTDPTEDKEKELWVELKRLYEPDPRDQLWALQKYMHDPLEWRLYDTCGVYHVSTRRGHEIFMLVEKDYPLKKGLTTVMLCNKLQVDHYSEMANELLMKIYSITNSSR